MEKINDRLHDRIGWIRDLVKTEESMEETGIVEVGASADHTRVLTFESLRFLQALKNDFVEAASTFNELKTSPLGRIKIYGIAKTNCDFMLFRNGFKMIFSFKNPGEISIRFNFIGPNYIPSQIPNAHQGQAPMLEEHLIVGKLDPFEEIKWTYQNEPVSQSSIVKFHLRLFIRESAK